MCITASQIQWTADVTKALGLTKDRGDQRAIKSLKKKQVIVNFVVFEIISNKGVQKEGCSANSLYDSQNID